VSRRILLLSSGGGHWVQLLRLRPAFEGHDVTFATVSRAYRADVGRAAFFTFPDASRWSKVRLVFQALRVLFIVLRVRPHVVVSTGAAAGYFALRFGRWFGARTVWIDSIANAERLSMSGELVRRHADLWLTQWPHLARPDGPAYAGAVL
jgi:hypothetical protein